MRDNPNTENGLAALRAVELKEDDPALAFLRRLQGYVIYSPTTPVLRGVAPETQPRQPLGLSGGRLPDAVHELLCWLVGKMDRPRKSRRMCLSSSVGPRVMVRHPAPIFRCRKRPVPRPR